MSTTKAHADEIARNGYTILEDVFSDATADALLADLDRLERELAIGPAKNLFEGTNTVRIYNLLVHGELYQQIALDPVVLPIVESVLDRGCLVSSLSSIAIRPGERPQPIHTDDQLIPIPRPHVPLVCNSMWAITDFTAANGATRIVPGSHLWDKAPYVGAEYEPIAAEMPRGSVMVYNGSMWHGGGANQSAERRVGIAMNYCAGFLRQQENQQLGVPASLVRTFPKRLREMVGYGIYNGVIGHIDRKHPAGLLDEPTE